MRGLHTQVSNLRKDVFVEVARIAYESDNITDDLEAIPYKLSPDEMPRFRDSVYRERAVSSERTRLALGLSLRPQNKPVHITSGLDEATVDEMYYEPPLMQVIPSACNACEDNVYEVSNLCRGCLAHSCMEVCPRDAITHVDGQAHIDKSKCVKCGKCKSACPYDAIGKKVRPCSFACGIKAIESDEYGRAVINQDKCLSCGMCMVSCPFGAIADKSQIFQLIRCMKNGGEVVAEIAPAYAGQFGKEATPDKIYAALLKLGFSQVYEVALGADIGAVTEAHDYVYHVKTGEKPFLLTSCCPAWSMLAKKQFPEIIDSVSKELTPMVATARSIKKEHPNARVVFIGPCAAKKLEASRKSVRSYVDFVLTFEEVKGMFDAKGVDFASLPEEEPLTQASSDGRGFAVSGGVAAAVVKAVKRMDPDREVKVVSANGLQECKKMLMAAKAGKYNGYLLEGMACPGGCIAGAGTVQTVKKAGVALEKMKKEASFEECMDTSFGGELEKLEEL